MTPLSQVQRASEVIPGPSPAIFELPVTQQFLCARERARTILRHYPPMAISEQGRAIAARFESDGDRESLELLLRLPDELFVSYGDVLRKRSGWDRETVKLTFERTAIVELSHGCHYDCAMCYVNAPAVESFIPWPHVRDIITTLAEQRREILAHDAIDILVSEALSERSTEPRTPLDVAVALARHRRNRFNNFSENFMFYFRSNPTNWRDPLFDKHFGHVAELALNAFQLANVSRLTEAAERDPAMRTRYEQEFHGNSRELRDALTTHAVVSTVPYARGSVGDRAVRYLLENGIATSRRIRVSAPHIHLLPSRSRQPERYWDNLVYTLRSAQPRIVYLFASTLEELRELAVHLVRAHEHSTEPWWIEARLVLYEIDQRRQRGESDRDILRVLDRTLKGLAFVGNAEGRGKRFIENPFFARHGTVMCVNGVVLEADGCLAYQACTDPTGEDVSDGNVYDHMEQWPAWKMREVVNSYPLVNRARESITRNLASIPRSLQRRPVDWFERRVEEMRARPCYAQTRARMAEVAAQAQPYLLFPVSGSGLMPHSVFFR